MSTNTKAETLKGGEFLIAESNINSVFIRDEISEEQQMIVDTIRQFIETEIVPNKEGIEEMQEGLMPSLLEKAGALGLTAMAIPEAYGGFGKDFNTNSFVVESMAGGHSFSVAFGAHTGIGTLPILYFGNAEQKEKYLPKLATAELKAAYCLTEPSSGSDALAAKSRADLSEDGTHYILNGQKMWITNAGFADVFIVFAKIDGEKFTGFIVHREYEGLTLGAEEKKMGIKGSSTRQVFFENVKVPVENVLGEIGKGHHIAFNILNIGRYKLCAGVLGGAKRSVGHAIRYANQRSQFGKTIGNFGAIKYKLGEMASRIYAAEAACYRTSGYIDDFEKEALAQGQDYGKALLSAAEEYAIECAMLKVAGSEVLDYVVDEVVQIHGGLGFSEEMPAARSYRDSRINRIFEGTNEINRMLSIDMLLKRAMSGKLNLMQAGMDVQKELLAAPAAKLSSDEFLDSETQMVRALKKAAILTIGFTAQKLMTKLQDEQEVLMWMADILSDVFLAESVLIRTKKLSVLKSESDLATRVDMTRIFLHDAAARVYTNGRNIISSFTEGEEAKMVLLGIKRFTKAPMMDTVRARRRVADELLNNNTYCF